MSAQTTENQKSQAVQSVTDVDTTAQVAALTSAEPVVLTKAEKKLQKRLEKEKKRAGKKRFPIKRTIFAVLVLGGIGYGVYASMMQASLPPMTAAALVEKGDLSQKVSLNGILLSNDTRQVYAGSVGQGTVGGQIETVSVKVGDWVEEGQELARLDTTDLETSIAKAKLSMGLSNARTELSLKQTEEKLNNAVVDVAAGMNTTLADAQLAVDRALNNLFDAQDKFYEAKDNIDTNEIALERAAQLRDRAASALDDARRALAQYEISNPADKASDTYKSYTKAVIDAEDKALTARENWDTANRQYGDNLSTESRALRVAREDYQRALDNKRIAEQSVDRSLKSMEYELESTRLAGDKTLEQMELAALEDKLTESVVKSPIAGMITAVYAKEGGASSGVLFVVEDTKNLLVKTSVKEADIANVTVGLPVEIKSDSTKDQAFKGEVKWISPTAAKAPDGTTQTSGTVNFDAELKLLEQSETLRVGVNVRAVVTTAEKTGVMYVPFDAVKTTAEGVNQIFALITDAAGVTTVKAIDVQTGMETDFYLEVSGEGIQEGMEIAADPNAVTDGMVVRTMGADAAAVMGTAASSTAG